MFRHVAVAIVAPAAAPAWKSVGVSGRLINSKKSYRFSLKRWTETLTSKERKKNGIDFPEYDLDQNSDATLLSYEILLGKKKKKECWMLHFGVCLFVLIFWSSMGDILDKRQYISH